MHGRGFMELPCPAGGKLSIWPSLGGYGAAEGLGNRLPETGNVFPFFRSR